MLEILVPELKAMGLSVPLIMILALMLVGIYFLWKICTYLKVTAAQNEARFSRVDDQLVEIKKDIDYNKEDTDKKHAETKQKINGHADRIRETEKQVQKITILIDK